MIKALAPAAALLLATGCMMTEREYDEGMEGLTIPSDFSDYTDQGIRPLGGQLLGDVGPSMRGLDDPAQLNGYHDSGFTSLEVIVTNERGSAMTMLDFHGSVTHPQIQPGARLTFDGSDTGGSDDVYVTGVACSGDSDPYDWTYDEPLDSVDLEVEETGNPDVMRLNFTTTDLAGDEAQGTIDMAVPSDG